MPRFLTLALLASAALPVAAQAQDDNERPYSRMERRENAPAPRADRGPRPERPSPVERADRPDRPQQFDAPSRPDRAPRPEQPNFTPPQSQAVPAVAADRGDWRGRRNDARRNVGREDRGDWQERRAVTPAPPPAAVVAPPRRDADRGRDNDARRGWNRNDDNRGNADRRDGDRRDWDRDNDNGRDWNRNDSRRDGNAGRNWNDNRRDANTGRNWNRDWRSDRRYDWQRYRTVNRNAYRLPRYYAPNTWRYGYRRFNVGAHLFAGLFAQNYWISDPFSYRLPPAYWPYQWVRYYDDAVLVDTRTGYVVDVIPGIFW